MRIALAAFAALIFSSFYDQAQADPYRWCAQYGWGNGGTNCYFVTLQQCQASVSGNGGRCYPNPYFTGRR
jgi:Protein of unknown function (DUF3551)